MSRKAVAHWTGKKVKFEVQAESGHTAVADEPPMFGDDEGMRPTEMLLGALGACTGVNAALLLKKYKQPYKALDVEVVGEQEEEWPKRFKKIEITFRIEWDGKHDKDVVERALDDACHKYCPVHATLEGHTEVTHRRKDV
jgi:putative redox protein